MAIIQYSNEGQQSKVNWGAILAGAFIAIAVQVALMSLAPLLHFSSEGTQQGVVDSQGWIRFGMYTLVANFISLMVGGYAVGRLADLRVKSLSALNAFCTWALVAVVSVALTDVGGGVITHTTTSAMMDASDMVASATGVVNAQFGMPDFQELAELNHKMGWITFLSFILGGIAAIVGGVAGGGGRKTLRRTTSQEGHLRHVA